MLFIQNKLAAIENVTSEDLKIQLRIDRVLPIEQQIQATQDGTEKAALQKIVIDSLELIYQENPNNVIIISRLSNAYGSLAWFQLFNKQYARTEEAALQGLEIDPSQEWINTNLALGLLFQGKWEEAQNIYESFKGKMYDDQNTWNDIFLKDLEELKLAGITHPDVEKVRALLGK